MRYSLLDFGPSDLPRFRRRLAYVLAPAATLAACLVGIVAWRRMQQEGGGPDTLNPHIDTFQQYNASLPMPGAAHTYNGYEDKRRHPKIRHTKDNYTHVFAIGDWGALLPSHKAAWRKARGYVPYAQGQVARAMKRLARHKGPQYVLNVGDNFYWQGITQSCNTKPSGAWGMARGNFQAGWRSMYGWLTNKPWLSALGNHDYGGFTFVQGWPQQIGYSFVNHHWIMPAQYYHKKMQHDGYIVEYFVTDSNALTAYYPGHHEKHNICSFENPPGASCAAHGGPKNLWDCHGWFRRHHRKQRRWLIRKVKASTADWKIAVTHSPCGKDTTMWRHLHQHHGLDLLVTGHRHQQELWHKGTQNGWIKGNMAAHDLGGLTCFVTGGGGGIDAEDYPGVWYGGRDLTWFGFFHLMISKQKIKVHMIDENGRLRGSTIVHARKKHHGPHSRHQRRLHHNHSTVHHRHHHSR
mmetsp:Transcript_3266/g.7851  ORF Transcript_3266/g.7851 Transcript_3266/m.7851 type:complete len:464 (+) Transcript_3266:75-1466(+)